jgi:hypothetical protein
MASKKKEPVMMMDFMLTKLDAEDQATAALIKPLPATVRPSADFLAGTRAHLLSAFAADASARHAA